MRYSPRVAGALRAHAVRASYSAVFPVIVLLWPLAAAAQAVALRWEAPPSCPETAVVQARISALLASVTGDNEPLRARGRIARTGVRGYRLELTLTTGAHRAQRTLRADDCAELADTAAWLVALAANPKIAARSNDEVGPSSASAQPPPTSQPAPAPPRDPPDPALRTSNASAGEAAAAPARPARAAAAERAPLPKPVRAGDPEGSAPTAEAPFPSRAAAGLSVHAGATAGIFWGLGTVAHASIAAFAGLGRGWSYTQARLAGLLPRSHEVAPNVTVDVWSLELQLSQCALWGTAVRVGPCLALAGLRTTAHVSGLTKREDRALLWVVAGAGLQLQWRLPRQLELCFGATAGVALSPRPRFTVEPLGAVVTAHTWSADARIGLAFASP